MKPTSWKWLEDGGVEIAGTVYKPSAAATEEALNAFGRDYSGSTMVFTVLFKAKRSFETGGVDYEGCRARLRGLLLEYSLAERELEGLANSFGSFLEPAGVEKVFGEDSQSYGRFILDALDNLGVKRDQ